MNDRCADKETLTQKTKMHWESDLRTHTPTHTDTNTRSLSLSLSHHIPPHTSQLYVYMYVCPVGAGRGWTRLLHLAWMDEAMLREVSVNRYIYWEARYWIFKFGGWKCSSTLLHIQYLYINPALVDGLSWRRVNQAFYFCKFVFRRIPKLCSARYS